MPREDHLSRILLSLSARRQDLCLTFIHTPLTDRYSVGPQDSLSEAPRWYQRVLGFDFRQEGLGEGPGSHGGLADFYGLFPHPESQFLGAKMGP